MERKRILVITVSLVVAMLATFLITRGANLRYETASRTVTAYEAAGSLPLRSLLTGSEVKVVQVPASLAQGLATSITGRTLLTPVMPGDLIFANELSITASLPPGQVSVSVPVDQAAADGVTAGDTVDVFSVVSGGPASLLAAGATVLSSFDAQGTPVTPGRGTSGAVPGLKVPGAGVPAVVELMVPAGSAQAIVQNNRNIYLVRVK